MNILKSSVGGYFPIIFSDGTIKKIPMNKVYIDTAGAKSIPENCFPILVGLNFDLKSANGWGWGEYYFGSEQKHALCKSYHEENHRYGSGGTDSAYVPFNCKDYNDLINGTFVRDSNRPGGISSMKYYIWAEK